MKPTAIYYTLMLGMLLVAGCSKDGAPRLQQPQPITFTASMADEAGATRGVDADLQVSGIRLYGYSHTAKITDANVKDAKHLFLNEKINADGSYAGARRYWTQDVRDLYFFYACNDIAGVSGSGGTTALPSVTFTQANEPTMMHDLVVADPIENLNPTGYVLPPVSLLFRHALAKVCINLYNTKATQLSSCNTAVRYSSGVIARNASFNIASPAVAATGTFHEGTYPLRSDFVISTNATDKINAVDGGQMMFIPQTITRATAPLLFVLDMNYMVSGTIEVRTTSVGIPIGAPQTILKRGYILNYYIEINVESNAMQITGVTLTDWNRVDAPPVDWSEY